MIHHFTIRIPVTDEGQFAMEGQPIMVTPLPYTCRASLQTAVEGFQAKTAFLFNVVRKGAEAQRLELDALDENPLLFVLNQAAREMEGYSATLSSIFQSGVIVEPAGIEWSTS